MENRIKFQYCAAPKYSNSERGEKEGTGSAVLIIFNILNSDGHQFPLVTAGAPKRYLNSNVTRSSLGY